MATNEKQKLIDQIAPYAVASQQQTGIPASITIAQFIQESGWTLSTLATQFNNFFGIKTSAEDPHKTWQPTKEFDNEKQVYYSTVAPFKTYNNPQESFNDHAKVLERLGITGGDPYQIADKLQANGYATDPEYASALKNLINDNNLTAYDSMVVFSKPSSGGILGTLKEAGKNLIGGLGDGVKSTVNPEGFYEDNGLTFDGKGTMYYTDSGGNTSPVMGENAPKYSASDILGNGFIQKSSYVGIIILVVLVMGVGVFVMIKDA